MITVDLTPVYPNITYIAFLLAVPIIFFKLSLWLLLITIPFLLGGFLGSSMFLYLGLHRGLRKVGYKGKIKFKRWSYVPNRNL